MIEISLFFDIETLPTIDASLIAEIASSIAPPARMSKADTIARWEIEERPAAIVEAVSKTGLDGGLGRVASIAFAHADGDVVCELALGDDGTPSRHAEVWLIEGFFAACLEIEKTFGVAPCMIGHNVQFDIRFLWKRALVLGVRPPHWWPVDAKPWDADSIQDTMVMWEGARGFISQDRLARILGIRGKNGFDGSMVAAAWAAGEFARIRDYNAGDVETVRAIWRRITGHVPKHIIVTAEKEAA